MVKKDCPKCGRKDVDYMEGGMCFVEHQDYDGTICDFSGHSDNTCCVKIEANDWPELIDDPITRSGNFPLQ